MTNFEKIKAMSVEEMAEFIKTMVDEEESHDVACYGCLFLAVAIQTHNTRTLTFICVQTVHTKVLDLTL